MKAASDHVNHQLPNEHTRVTHLLEAIENDDAALQAAIVSVEADVGTSAAGVPGKRDDFELAAAHLLPKDPVAKKRVSQKRPVAELSDVSGAPGGEKRRWESGRRVCIFATTKLRITMLCQQIRSVNSPFGGSRIR